MNEQPSSNVQFDRPSDQPIVPAPTQQPTRESRIGWYLLGCFVLFLIVAAFCVLGGLLFTAAPAGGIR